MAVYETGLQFVVEGQTIELNDISNYGFAVTVDDLENTPQFLELWGTVTNAGYGSLVAFDGPSLGTGAVGSSLANGTPNAAPPAGGGGVAAEEEVDLESDSSESCQELSRVELTSIMHHACVSMLTQA